MIISTGRFANGEYWKITQEDGMYRYYKRPNLTDKFELFLSSPSNIEVYETRNNDLRRLGEYTTLTENTPEDGIKTIVQFAMIKQYENGKADGYRLALLDFYKALNETKATPTEILEKLMID